MFSENGLVFYEKGQLKHQKSLEEYLGHGYLNQFVSYAQEYIDHLEIPVKTSHFVEIRNGLINISPIGRNCSQNEREEFEIYDQKHHIRAAMIETLKNRFHHLNFHYSIGGQISFDVFPIGWDKTYCLDYLPKNQIGQMDSTIHFFGDKTQEGGNDHEIFIDKRVIGHSVRNYHETIDQIKSLLKFHNIC